MSAILSADDLNDFISPGVACIKPVETLPLQKPDENNNPYEVTTEDKVPAQDHAPAQISLTDCLACSGCVTSAEAVLVSLQSHSEVFNALDAYTPLDSRIDAEGRPHHGASGGKIFVASVSPQVRASIAATYGISQRRAGWMIDQLLAGSSGLASGGLHRNRFSWIVDTNAMREACLVLGADEVLRSPPLFGDNEVLPSSSCKKPVLSSACPGWICYAEKTHPHVLPHLSRLKSPQALTGTLLKTVLSQRLNIRPDQIWHLAVMPCFDKKLEASREELTDLHWRPSPPAQEPPGPPTRDVDCVITARELLMLADSRGISFPSLPQEPLPASSTPPFPDTSLDAFLFPHRQLHPRKKRQRPNQDPSAGPSGGYLHHILQSQLALHPNSTLQTTRGRNADVVEYAIVTSTPFPHSNPTTTTSSSFEKQEATNTNGAAQAPNLSNNTVLFRAARYYGSRNIANLVRKLKPPKPRRLLPTARNPSSSSSPAAPGATGGMPGYAYVEVMACPGGCTNGGGQIKASDVGGTVGEGVGQKEWLARVDEAYYSMSDSDSDSSSLDPAELGQLHQEEGEKEKEGVMNDGKDEGDDDAIINGIDVGEVRRVLAHWSESTGIGLERLCFTTFREVKSEVGKIDDNKQQERVVEQLAGKIGGGW